MKRKWEEQASMWEKLPIFLFKKKINVKKKKGCHEGLMKTSGLNKEELLVAQGPRWDAPSRDNQLSDWLIRRNYSANQPFF